jgi:NAD(P)-dependent dehydrogenase (short-subunit alcohol dehydrogenase family)
LFASTIVQGSEMRIIVVGATGTIGQFVVQALRERHEIVAVGNRGGEHRVDIKNASSIRSLFEKTGPFDALVSAVGKVHFGDFAKLTEKEVRIGLDDKLMGQVNLVLIGRDYARDAASFTLTSGVLSHDPIRHGAAASLVNGAIDAFVRAAAIELPRGIRINAVSPGVLEESLPAYGPYFLGHEAVPGKRVANAFVKSVEGRLTGQVIRVL